MQTSELETKRAPLAWYAAQDAKMRSYAASTHYSSQQKLEVDRVKMMMEEVYAGRVFTNFRKKFAVVKIEDARVRLPKMLKELEAEYERRGYTKAVTAQGVIYRIPKKAN